MPPEANGQKPDSHQPSAISQKPDSHQPDSKKPDNRVGGKRSSFLPTFVFRPLTPPYVRFRIRRFFILRAI